MESAFLSSQALTFELLKIPLKPPMYLKSASSKDKNEFLAVHAIEDSVRGWQVGAGRATKQEPTKPLPK